MRPLNNIRIAFSVNNLRMNEWILIKFCLCIDIDNIKLGIVKCPFSSIHYRVVVLVALDCNQYLVYSQYPLEI